MNALPVTAWCAALFASSSLFSHDVALRLVLLALSFACAAAAIATQRRELRLVPPIWWPYLLWAMWAALSVTWSIEPEASNKEFRNEILYTGAAFFVCYIGGQAPRAARAVIVIVGLASTLLCAVAFYSFFQGVQAYADGWHGGPGNLSTVLLMLMPCVLAAAWYARGSPKVLLLALALALLMLLAAYTTLNRTIWVGMSIEVLLLGALAGMRKADRLIPRVRTAGLLLTVTVVAVFVLIAARVQTERVEADPAGVMSKDIRFKLWKEILTRIEAAPLTGYGFGRGRFGAELTEQFGNPYIWHAHNLFLDITLQTGIPGLLLFLLLLGVMAREGWRATRAADEECVACGLALLGLLAGMVTRNMTDTILVRHSALFFWAAAGFLLGWKQLRSAKA